jgi:hypothetical protein
MKFRLRIGSQIAAAGCTGDHIILKKTVNALTWHANPLASKPSQLQM